MPAARAVDFQPLRRASHDLAASRGALRRRAAPAEGDERLVRGPARSLQLIGHLGEARVRADLVLLTTWGAGDARRADGGNVAGPDRDPAADRDDIRDLLQVALAGLSVCFMNSSDVMLRVRAV